MSIDTVCIRDVYTYFDDIMNNLTDGEVKMLIELLKKEMQGSNFMNSRDDCELCGCPQSEHILKKQNGYFQLYCPICNNICNEVPDLRGD